LAQNSTKTWVFREKPLKNVFFRVFAKNALFSWVFWSKIGPILGVWPKRPKKAKNGHFTCFLAKSRFYRYLSDIFGVGFCTSKMEKVKKGQKWKKHVFSVFTVLEMPIA